MSVYRQDMPPQGGYASIRTAQLSKPKGISNRALLALSMGMCVFGLGRYIYYQRQENELRMARAEERTAYAPIVKKFLVERDQARDAAIWRQIDQGVQRQREKIASQE